MAKVIDYAWTGPSAQWIKNSGYAGVMRYISHDGSKDLSAPERDALRALNLTIGLVFESFANRSTQGQRAGHDDAVFANQVADSLGYPPSCALWYAVDFDASWSQVAAYFLGVAQTSRRPWGPYGSANICDASGSPAPPWQTVAWSGGRRSAHAGLLQNVFDRSGGGASFDVNEVLIPAYGAWGASPLPEPPKEEKLQKFVTDTVGLFVLDPVLGKRWIPTMDDYHGLINIGSMTDPTIYNYWGNIFDDVPWIAAGPGYDPRDPAHRPPQLAKLFPAEGKHATKGLKKHLKKNPPADVGTSR